MIKACVIGWPITHSRSPLIHGYWLKHNGIDGSYERVAVEPSQLQDFLTNLKANGFVGCNVTIPHKEAAISAIQHIDDSVKKIGALNTVYIKDDKTHATSTDGEGFFQNLLAHVPDFDATQKCVTILGAGGSAKAIIERLLREDVKSITIINRTITRANDVKTTFGEKIFVCTPEKAANALGSCDLLINTTSQGMTGQPDLQLDLILLAPRAVVADIVYVPLKTQLLKDAEARGHRIVPGLGMLLHQAVRGFELWFGVKPEVTPELYTLIARDIDPDYQP
jgi:shikimate dehydrogenase